MHSTNSETIKSNIIHDKSEVIRLISGLLIEANHGIESKLYKDIMMVLESEDHLIANFKKHEEDRYRRAIEKSGIKELYISDKAYARCGQALLEHSSVRATCEVDIHKFWDALKWCPK